MGAPLTSGTTLHGRYTVATLLQTGPDGALYLGTDAFAAAKVVLICESTDLSPEGQARFAQEAQLLAGLEHPSLPVALDSFAEPSGRLYLVLLGFEEPSLGQLLSDGACLVEADVLDWFGRLAEAVEYLHLQRPPIVHGRISPAYIVITADGTPHLTGLLNLEGADGADSPYLAPEQWEGRLDERTDVYGLAATLYTLLTGRAPATASARAAGEELVPPRQLNRDISPRVEAAILKAMELDPALRPAGVGQLWQALTQPMLVEETGSRNGWRRLREPKERAPRRLPRWLLPAAVVGVLLLAAVAVMAWRLLPSDDAQSPRPSSPAAASALVSSTATRPVASPTPAPLTAAPGATAVPAAAATAVATPAPTAAPRAVPSTPQPMTTRWFAGPTASATLRWFPAPEPISPANGSVVTGSIEFRWSWPYTLADDEYFDLQVYRIGVEPTGIAWCKEPYYRPRSLVGGEGQYMWRVRVIRGSDGQVQGVVSDASPERMLMWQSPKEEITATPEVVEGAE